MSNLTEGIDGRGIATLTLNRPDRHDALGLTPSTILGAFLSKQTPSWRHVEGT